MINRKYKAECINGETVTILATGQSVYGDIKLIIDFWTPDGYGVPGGSREQIVDFDYIDKMESGVIYTRIY